MGYVLVGTICLIVGFTIGVLFMALLAVNEDKEKDEVDE